MTKFSCGFCQREFRSEGTLVAHMCPTKRRHAEKDSTMSRLGLGLYQKFYDLNTPGKKPKTFEDFALSRYYSTFIKLARHLGDLKPVEQDRFVDYLFTTGVKEKQWCSDKTYEKYIVDLTLKENPERALERSILHMEKWAKDNGVEYSRFFHDVSTGEATMMIRYGRISPWVLYLADSADALWERMSSEQAEIIAEVIDPKAWRKRFETKIEQRQFVKNILNEAGL